MSLKHVHLIFITMATLLLGGFSVWCFMREDGGAGDLIGGIVGVILTICLIIYGVLYWKKINKIIT